MSNNKTSTRSYEELICEIDFSSLLEESLIISSNCKHIAYISKLNSLSKNSTKSTWISINKRKLAWLFNDHASSQETIKKMVEYLRAIAYFDENDKALFNNSKMTYTFAFLYVILIFYTISAWVTLSTSDTVVIPASIFLAPSIRRVCIPESRAAFFIVPAVSLLYIRS